jgi:cytochrome P450
MRTTAAVASIPAVPGQPLLGNLGAFRKDRLALQDAAAALGPISRFQLLNIPVYVVTDADLAHQLLVEHGEVTKKSKGLEFLAPVLGAGLLSSEGEPHKRHRKLLAPAFAPRRLAGYGEVMVDETIAQLDRWAAGPRQVDLAAEMMQLTLAIAGRTLFGASIRGEAAQVARGLDLAMHSMVKNLTSAIRLPYPWPLPRHLEMYRAVRMLDEVVYRLIEGRRREGGAEAERSDVLSTLMAARDEGDGQGFTDRQLRDEVMTLLLAGHETTANLLTWTYYELGRHPEVAARLRAEVAEVIGDRRVTMDDLPRLPLIAAVLDEAMRLHPPAYTLGREATADLTLGDHRMPAGSTIIVNIRGIHRRADYYPAPDEFRPERMFADAKKARPRHHYLPFGAGPRVCIGQHFALLEGQLALATLIQRAEIRTLTKDVAPEPLVTLRPLGGLPAIAGQR